MAYLIRKNDFARFELIDAKTEEVIATSSHPQDLCELATCLLPADEVSCLPVPETQEKKEDECQHYEHFNSKENRYICPRKERRVVEVLPGGVRRTEEPLSPLTQAILKRHNRKRDPLENEPELRKMRIELFGF